MYPQSKCCGLVQSPQELCIKGLVPVPLLGGRMFKEEDPVEDTPLKGTMGPRLFLGLFWFCWQLSCAQLALHACCRHDVCCRHEVPLHHGLEAISVTRSPLSWFLGCLLSFQTSTDTESWHQVGLLWQQLRMWGASWTVQEECGSLQEQAGKTPAYRAILIFTLKTPSKPGREGTS